MENHESEKNITGMAGEFLTIGKLFKRRYQASVTLGNAKAVDVLVYNPENNKTFAVQVKTLRRKNCFFMKKDNLKADHIYVFVLLNDFEQPEEYFILAGREIAQDIDKFFGFGKPCDPNKPSKYIDFNPLKPYRDNWKVFDT